MHTQPFGTLAGASVLIAASIGASGVAHAEDPWSFSANLGVVSNYMWRGVTQTDEQPAVQGGLDISHVSGFYAGTWASNVDFGTDASYELDFLAGYDFTLPVEDASLGLSTIYVAYPDSENDIDFWEVGISGGYKFLSLGIQYTVWGDEDNEDTLYDQGDIYYSIALDFPLPKDFSIGLFGGYYDYNNDQLVVDVDDNGFAVTEGADYGHWGVSISKDAGDFGSFSFNYEQNDGDDKIFDDDAKVWVGWNKEF